MNVRNAEKSDKSIVLNFCRDTFSWGDYIEDVWDSWLDEGNLFVVDQNDVPIGLCHAFFSNNHVWIEGIRIENSARRMGLATKLILHVESLAIKNKFFTSLMLIDVENSASLLMAKNLNYNILETWKFYSLIPKLSKFHDIKFGIKKNIQFSYYVKSWRWLNFDQNTITSLCDDTRIVYSDQNTCYSFAICTDSEHFEKTLIVTFHAGSVKNTLNLISYIRNFAFENHYQRIQILSKEILPTLEDLEHRLSFHLMIKKLN